MGQLPSEKSTSECKPLVPGGIIHAERHAPCFDVVVIGASAGGPKALYSLISQLPENFPAAIIIVQHMPAGNYTGDFAKRLNAASKILVREAVHRDIVKPGIALIVPGGKQLTVNRTFGRYYINIHDSYDLLYNPSIDVTMRSVSVACGKKALGILLTGMGNDGALGMKIIKSSLGRTLAESEETCMIYSMPKAAVNLGVVDKIVPLNKMAQVILSEVLPI